jgi:hypothetical protein
MTRSQPTPMNGGGNPMSMLQEQGQSHFGMPGQGGSRTSYNGNSYMNIHVHYVPECFV